MRLIQELQQNENATKRKKKSSRMIPFEGTAVMSVEKTISTYLNRSITTCERETAGAACRMQLLIEDNLLITVRFHCSR